MPARGVRSQDLAACGDLKAFCHCLTCLAASDWFRHEGRKIALVAALTTLLRLWRSAAITCERRAVPALTRERSASQGKQLQ
jgi:hypothetical protein